MVKSLKNINANRAVPNLFVDDFRIFPHIKVRKLAE